MVNALSVRAYIDGGGGGAQVRLLAGGAAHWAANSGHAASLATSLNHSLSLNLINNVRDPARPGALGRVR